MRRAFIVLAVLLSLVLTAYADGHRYISGRVIEKTSDTIKVGDVTLTVPDGVKVFRDYKAQGRFERETYRFSRIYSGDKVRVKALHNTAQEIVLEDY